MAIGTRGTGRAPRWHYPKMQAPDVEEGGGGGGGEPPVAPSDITVVGTAHRLIGWGGYHHVNISTGQYATLKNDWGYAGYVGRMGNSYLSRLSGLPPTMGNTQRFKVSSGTNVVSAAGDADSAYNYQKAYEGLGVASINGGGTGLGMFKAKQADPSIKCYLACFMCQSTQPGTGPWGPWTDTAERAAVAAAFANRAAGCKFLGGDGIYLDFEKGHWQDYPPSAETMTLAEAWGYDVGAAIYAAWPACEILMYHWIPETGWHHRVIINNVGVGGGQEPQFRTVNSQRTAFIFGLMRAHATAQSTAAIRHQDAVFYRAPTQIAAASRTTQMQAQLNSLYAHVSQNVPAATRNWTTPYVYHECCSWAGTDSGGSAQPGEPTFSQMQADYKIWAAGGMRADYNFEGSPLVNANLGIWAPNNNYSYPAGRLAGMVAASVPANHPSTAAPSLSAVKSGTGSTRTITGTASHPYAIHWVRAYIYPSGTPVYAVMTWNTTGMNYSTGFNAAYMDYTISLTGVTAGQFAIVQAQTPFGHQHSVVVEL